MFWNNVDRMSQIAGVSDFELEAILQKLRNGESVRVEKDGAQVVVNVEYIDPNRVQPETI